MKTLKKLLSLMLCLGLALTALVFPAAQAEALGGYVEQDLSSPTGYASFTAPVSTPQGGMAMAGKRADTGAWELLTWSDLESEPKAAPLTVPEGDITAISIAPDGQVLATIDSTSMMSGGSGMQMKAKTASDDEQADGAVVQGGGAGSGESQIPGDDAATQDGPQRIIMTPDDMKTKVMWFDADGSPVAEFQISGMAYSVRALSGQRTASLSVGSGVDIYDANGSVEQSISKNNVYGLATTGDDLVLLQAEKVSVVDVSTGKELRAAQVEQNYTSQLVGATDGNIYLVGETGIYKLEPQGNAFVKTSESTGFSIGDPQSGLSAVCALGDGSLVAYFSEGGISISGGVGYSTSIRLGSGEEQAAQLLAYRYVDTLDLSQRTPFVVTALRDSSKLRKAVSDFQRAHPELDVKLSTQLSEYDYETAVEDAIRTLNTDLLAGKGGDVLILDELPLAKYIERGVLRPLNDALADIDFLPGILEGSRSSDGNIYAMPAQFSVQTQWGTKEELAGIHDLTSLNTMPLKDFQSALSARTPEAWLRLFYPSSEFAFRDAQGKLHFDTPEFETFLESLYGLYAAQVERVEPQASGATQGLNIDISALSAMQTGAQALFDLQISSTMSAPFGYTAAGADENVACSLVPSLSGAGVAYTPSMLAGINTLTTQNDLAVEFLRSLYAPALQEMDQADGLPTVAASLEKLISDVKARNDDSDTVIAMMISNGEDTFSMEQPDNATWDALYALLQQVKQPAIVDETLMRFMVEETASFFEGQGDAQQAALALDQRAAAYLGE